MARILIGNIKGPQGIPGAKGDKGDVGPRGPAGPAGSVDNTTPIEFTEAAQREDLVSGDSIATLFGKQKKWNTDMKDVAFSGSYNDLTDVPVTKREMIPSGSDLNRYTDSGEFYYSYGIAPTIINAPFNKGTVLFVMNMEENGIIQLALDRTAGSLSNVVIRRHLDTGWSEWKNFYGEFNKPTPADIGAANTNDLIGVWKNWTWQSNTFGSPGWFRIAQGNGSCTISIKRGYHSAWSEAHKVELMLIYTSAALKSIYDKSYNDSFFEIKKIRVVRVGSTNYIDIYYDSNQPNGLTFLVSDAVDDYGGKYVIFDNPQIVPETAEGETILAVHEFKKNSWVGEPTPADIGAVSADELEVRKYVMPQPSANDIFKSFDVFVFDARRTGKVVNLVINLVGAMEAVNEMTLLGTLPKEYRPSNNSAIQNYVSQTGVVMIIQITPSGEVLLYNGNTKISGRICGQTITYVVD